MFSKPSILELLLLIIVILTFITIYKVVSYIINKIKSDILKNIVNTCFSLLFILNIIISTKLFVFDIYKIPSISMGNTLFSGDIILVDKLKYGARLPRSPYEIPWFNIVFYYRNNAKERIKEHRWNYKRIIGVDKVKQGDVIVFNSVSNKYDVLVKRCVASAGDTLNIKNAKIHINNKLFISQGFEKNYYTFLIKNEERLDKVIDSLKFIDLSLINFKKKFNKGNLTKHELEILKTTQCIDSIIIQIDTFDISKKLFCNLKKWTLDNMGPFVIPKKGMRIELNAKTYSLYQQTINNLEGNSLKKINDFYYLNSCRVNEYIFKQNYYFMMGDNRKKSLDSRYWGFVPESNIIGKVECILFSNFNSNFQWSRLFKDVN